MTAFKFSEMTDEELKRYKEIIRYYESKTNSTAPPIFSLVASVYVVVRNRTQADHNAAIDIVKAALGYEPEYEELNALYNGYNNLFPQKLTVNPATKEVIKHDI